MTDRIEGWLFEAGRSAAQGVVLTVDDAGLATLSDASGRLVRSFPWSQVRIDDRIGDTARSIALPDGAVIETRDNAALEALERDIRRSGTERARAGGIVAALERRWTAAAVAVLLTVAAAWAIVQWGMPAVADFVATRIPPETAAGLDQPVLDALGRLGMSESALPQERRRRIETLFDSLVAADPDGPAWRSRLVFRNGGRIGANAFALPGGTVVITDRLVEIAASDTHVAAVLAHELGHVQGRHGLKRLARGAGLGLLTLYLFGDVTSISHIVASFPVLLIESGYSRDFESAADAAAVDTLRRAFLPPQALIEMLDILSADCGARCNAPGWLSSHPLTLERKASLRALIDVH